MLFSVSPPERRPITSVGSVAQLSTKSRIDPDVLRAMIRAAGPPVVVETPGGAKGMGEDVQFVRDALA